MARIGVTTALMLADFAACLSQTAGGAIVVRVVVAVIARFAMTGGRLVANGPTRPRERASEERRGMSEDQETEAKYKTHGSNPLLSGAGDSPQQCNGGAKMTTGRR